MSLKTKVPQRAGLRKISGVLHTICLQECVNMFQQFAIKVCVFSLFSVYMSFILDFLIFFILMSVCVLVCLLILVSVFLSVCRSVG